MRFVPRKHLPHDVPGWVADGALYFITIHAAKSGNDQFTQAETGTILLEAVQHYHDSHRWFARLFLLMPDHVHALLAFPREESMRRVVADWKRYTVRRGGVRWQRDFFDHRLRSDESWELKAGYIRTNPVRKGLIAA